MRILQDTRAINTIAQTLSETEDWIESADLLDDIAAVLDAVRPKIKGSGGAWRYGKTLTWKNRRYV